MTDIEKLPERGWTGIIAKTIPALLITAVAWLNPFASSTPDYTMTELPPITAGTVAELTAHFNAQTARLAWPELARHFARGVVVKVAPGMDPVAVAVAMAQDRADEIDIWTRAGQVQRASDEDARDWHAEDSVFWAVVVAPWVLVQEIRE
jgi:hypothetical protein